MQSPAGKPANASITSMKQHTMQLSFSKPPITLNSSFRHWSQRAKVVKEIRREAMVRARAARLGPYRHITTTLHYQPRDRRRRDPSNLVGTQKPLLDGLVDAGVVPDDTPEYVTESMPVIHPPVKGEPGRMWLTITVLA